MNVGSLKKIFTAGEKFDKTSSESDLSSLKDLLGMESNDHAFVVW